MRILRRITLGAIAAAFTFTAASARAQVVINEIMADNDTVFEDPNRPGDFDDWIELYNAGDEAADIGGMFITDTPLDPMRWPVPPGTTVPAGGFLVLWADNDTDHGPTHMNFKLSSDGETLCIFERDGVTRLDFVEFGPQESDVSFGRFPDGGERFLTMREPTPGSPNSSGESGLATFSVAGGTFSEPFELELGAGSPDATIHYTLDGSEPDDTSPEYTGPITIDETVRVRARVFEESILPGPIASGIYIEVAADVREFESNLPIVLLDTRGVSIDSMTRRPRRFQQVLSAFIDTSAESGRARITDLADFAGHGGMHVRGSSTAQYPKKQYRFEFWDERDLDLPVTIFGLPRESDWILQAPYSDKTLMRNHSMYKWSTDIGRYAVRTRFCEVFMQSGAGAITTDDYRGVYVFMENIKRDNDRVDIARLEPADNEEPEITGGYLLKKDWLDTGDQSFTTSTYRDRLTYVDPEGPELTPAQKDWVAAHFDEFEAALSGPRFDDPDEGYEKFIDVESFIDHHLMVEMARNVDGYVLSTYLYKDRGGKITMGPIWDYNGALGGADYFCSFDTEGWHYEFNENTCGGGGETFPADNGNAYHWYERLFEDPNFRLRYATRWTELRAGPLATDNILEDIAATVELLTDDGAADSPVTRNFERWNILNRYIWPNFKASGTYEEHVGWMVEWLTGRLAWMDGALTVPPTFDPPGGLVEGHIDVTLAAPAGTIYFTINGPDPMAEGGDAAPEAVRYEAPIAIDGQGASVLVRARALHESGVWTDMAEAVYVTEVVQLAVTEIMYNPAAPPAGSPFSRRNFEFVELMNIGPEPTDLVGVALVGRAHFEFAGSDIAPLAPGERVVVAGRLEAFASRYDTDGLKVVGVLEGLLGNTSQEVTVEGPLGTLARFTYGDWYPSTDGQGHSLVLVDPFSAPETWSDEGSWRPSIQSGGSPGRPDEAPPGGLQRPGDIDQDSRLNISDAIQTLDYLFRGAQVLPCESEEANLRLLDVNADDGVDLNDAVHTLGFLFLRGEPPALGTACIGMAGCPDTCDDA